MALARNIGDDFLPVCEAHLGDFAESGVRLLRGAGHNLDAHATTLRTIGQGGRLGFDFDFLASLADELVDCGHSR